MAHLINAEQVSVVLGARDVLAGVSLGLDDGDRVGVVGRNGDGKSTLLRVLTGEHTPDGGRVTRTRGVRVGVLPQADDPDATGTVRHLVVGDAEDHAWAGDARVRDVVSGLLDDIQVSVPGGLDAPLSTLSGGQRRRAALAAVLVGDHDLVVLDEPTNHLDVEGVAWLAEHLRRRWPAGRGALLVVTHDRWFLDAVCDETWEVTGGGVERYDGGYAAYVLARAERARVAQVTADRQANLLRKELAWLRRGAPARTSKPKFRLDAAAALVASEPPPRETADLTSTASARLGKDVLDLEDVVLRVPSPDGGAPRTLLDGVTWRLAPGERVGVVGVNGAGKTTVLRLLTGELEPDAGRVRRGKTVRVAVLSQSLHELAEVADLRALEAVERERREILVDGKPVSASSLVERLGFTRDRAWTPVGELSGGERRRLQLLRLLVHEPNVLLLDEPTNDLDTDVLASVEDVLDGFRGTLVVVSHDRYLLERTTDHQVALLGDGHLRDLPGGVEEYLALRAGVHAAPVGGVLPGVATAGDAAAATAAAGGPSAADVRAARKEVSRLERRLEKLQTSEAGLLARMADAAADHAAVTALDAELRAVVAEREQVEEAWLEAAETAG
ncbi:ABC-F family ATP-binding cassette domain-containing protein [Pseudokineococcus lusitanus]|uniref:ATPase subunit of ABC transporter with duplicated ATPase domains n=1 Tax=Pseudokineococcus lusitanus TaxID=763993 RepID=A0A3N1HKG3_9ACTN|nr:ABC-F family ATP-binding cassette domain-containing protein [Pseudokineococcus lusitanus]ROP42970.1 ATPase subunit of ABC transporter with duplicated ATPase domains [Pseudokineococcus lusitanus]